MLKNIIKNASIILSGNAAASALGFFSFIIMAKSIGPTYLGYFALAQAYVLIANSLFNVQTWESLIKFGSQIEFQNQLRSTIKTNCAIDLASALLAFLAAVVSLPLIASLLQWEPELIDIAYLYCFTIPFSLTTLTIGIPRLFNKFFTIAKIQFATALIKIGFIWMLTAMNSAPASYINVYIMSEIILNISLILLSLLVMRDHKTSGWLRAKMRLAKNELIFLWWTNLRTIVRIPVRQLDVFIINQVMSLDSVGIYKAYKEIVSIIDRLGEPVNQALYPEYSKLIGNNKSEESVAVTKKIILLLTIMSGIIFIGFISVSKPLITHALGPEYLAFIGVFYIMVVLNSINLALTPINSLFIAAGFAKFSFYLVLCNNILYLCVAILGGMHWGMYGIVLAFASQMFFNQGLKLVLIKKYPDGWSNTIR